MVDFSIRDIVRNLLLAARWTVVLSIVAVIGGGIVGLYVAVRGSAATASPASAYAVMQVFHTRR